MKIVSKCNDYSFYNVNKNILLLRLAVLFAKSSSLKDAAHNMLAGTKPYYSKLK